MKKIALVFLMTALLVPVSLFAAPTDEEVYKTSSGVMSVFALVFMSSMFGQAPENVTVDSNLETGASTMTFDKFQVQTFVDSMSQMMQASGSGEDFDVEFDEMSGKIIVNEAGDLDLDVDLKGGSVKNLIMKSEGEDLVTIKADGKNYAHLRDRLMAEE